MLIQILLGSRIATGGVSAEELSNWHDENGTSFIDAATWAGFPAKNHQVEWPAACKFCLVQYQEFCLHCRDAFCMRALRLRAPGLLLGDCFSFLDVFAPALAEGLPDKFMFRAVQEFLDKSRLETSGIDAFLELHIEQGPLLENESKQIGIVTSIFGPALVHVQFNGSGGHGGGMPMEFRCVSSYTRNFKFPWMAEVEEGQWIWLLRLGLVRSSASMSTRRAVQISFYSESHYFALIRGGMAFLVAYLTVVQSKGSSWRTRFTAYSA